MISIVFAIHCQFTFQLETKDEQNKKQKNEEQEEDDDGEFIKRKGKRRKKRGRDLSGGRSAFQNNADPETQVKNCYHHYYCFKKKKFRWQQLVRRIRKIQVLEVLWCLAMGPRKLWKKRKRYFLKKTKNNS